MLSGLVASPTLDLGGRSRNASSKLAFATVDPTAPASEVSINPVTRAAISIEYASLRHDKHCPTGMYVTPSSESMLVWDAVLFVHKGEWWQFRDQTSLNSRVLSRRLCRLRPQVCHGVPRQLPRSTSYGALRDGRIPPARCESDRGAQLDGTISTLEVSYLAVDVLDNGLTMSRCLADQRNITFTTFCTS